MNTPNNDNNQDPTTNAIERVTETMGGAIGSTALGPGLTPENQLASDVELPPAIHDLLDYGLVDADLPGEVTRKCNIVGHPELLARHVEGTTEALTSEAMRIAKAINLPITPTTVVVHGGEPWYITKKVDGSSLEELLPAAPLSLLAEVDAQWASLNRKLAKAYQDGMKWPVDIEGPRQWMYGILRGDTQQRFWLVDLPTESARLDRGDGFGYELVYSLSALCDMEELSGVRMVQARQALDVAINLCPASENNGDALQNALRYCLDHGLDPRIISDDPDFLDSMRTK